MEHNNIGKVKKNSSHFISIIVPNIWNDPCMCVKKGAHDIEGTLTEQSLPLS